MKDRHKVQPITVADLLEFRDLLVGRSTSESDGRIQLAAMLGVTGMSLWRWEMGGVIQHPVMVRLALTAVADNHRVDIPKRLRFGKETT